MAGKHNGGMDTTGFFNPGLTTNLPPTFPGSRVDRAYAEGRAASPWPGNNPHPAGTPENNAYSSGAFFGNQEDAKVQTGIPPIGV